MEAESETNKATADQFVAGMYLSYYLNVRTVLFTSNLFLRNKQEGLQYKNLGFL